MKHFFPVLILLFFVSCQNERKGIIDADTNQPFLSKVELNYYLINIDNDIAGIVDSIGINKYRIKLVFIGYGNLNESKNLINGTLQVQKSTASSPFYNYTFSTHMLPNDSIFFNDSISFSIRRDETGDFRILISLNYGNSRKSNTIEKLVHIVRNNVKPVINSYLAPDTLFRPNTGIKYLQFNLSVSDSDGYADIRSVFLKRIFPTETSPVYLFDDGAVEKNGDMFAGDGIFSRILSIDSTARLGDQIFLFRAEDNSGAVTDTLLHTITILP
ncbi:MAG: hypothetical protein HY964_10400 [Ignavibacteriales bacterium]|nr:hypothetical protein [Ignavibacteriales bacterium]